MTSPWLHELAWPAVEAHLARDDVVLIPVGATEQHGRHLPLLADTGWAIACAEAAARAAGCLVAPPIHVGWSPHHLSYPGSLTLRPETLTALVLDIGESLVVHGFKRIVVVNGNRIANLPPLEIALSKLRHRTGALAALADVGLIAKTEIAQLREGAPGSLDHAGESETAMMLAWRPELVDMEKAVTHLPARASTFHEHLEFEPEFTENAVGVIRTAADHPRGPKSHGVTGDATKASAEKGQAMIQAIAANVAKLIEELRAKPNPETSAAIPH